MSKKERKRDGGRKEITRESERVDGKRLRQETIRETGKETVRYSRVEEREKKMCM